MSKTNKRFLEERVDFLEVTAGKLWDELSELQEKVAKIEAEKS